MRALIFSLLTGMALALAPGAQAETQFEHNNRILLDQLAKVHRLTPKQKAEVEAIFRRSGYIGQGNPAITRHPMTVEECRARAPRNGNGYADRRFERICGAKYMAPLYDPRTEKPEDAKACIDQFEFPDIPCTYPVTWVRAKEAAEICAAMGKRICDAHEWEGACAGALEPPDYPFGAGSVAAMRSIHNSKYAATKSWAYGPEYKRGVCAANSSKSSSCDGGGWSRCGTNTYPTGSFPGCVSKLGVYDIHGNAAEHMNLPMKPSQMASNGSKELGVTEMKGSWFIWDKIRAHPDWCRWRAPYWHGSRVMSPGSHSNYHLGFRCCKTID